MVIQIRTDDVVRFLQAHGFVRGYDASILDNPYQPYWNREQAIELMIDEPSEWHDLDYLRFSWEERKGGRKILENLIEWAAANNLIAIR